MAMTNSDDLSQTSDTQLLQLCGNGDDRAFGQIVERYQSLVCSVAFNRCGDLALSEDLAQEAFIVAWQKLAELKDAARFKAWICTIVRNLANRSLQRQGLRNTTDLDAIPDVATDSQSPVAHAARAEEETLVWQALAEIPVNYREPLILFYREAQSVARVSEALDLSQDAVKQRLSRGRKMVQEHLAATVESVLTNSKPGKKFTGAVLAGVAGLSAKTATAAGGTSGATTVASIASSTGGVASGLGSLWLGPILQLPVLGWLFKTSYADMRTDQERQLWRRFILWAFCGLMVFLPAAFSFVWWQQYVQPVLLRSLVVPGMMVVYTIPVVILSRRFGQQMERLRREEGRFTQPKPLFGVASQGRQAWKTHLGCCASGLLVMAWPAILPFFASDWWVMVAMLAVALLLGWISAQFCLRYPSLSFQLYGTGIGLTLLASIAIIIWRREFWQPAFSNFLLWPIGVMQASSITMVILTTVAWKRVYARHE